MDIASLAIQINTSDVSRAGQELDKLAGAGKKVEQAASGIAAATKADLGSAATTWKQFISERLSDYRRVEGGHAEAMRRIADEWKQHRESLRSGFTPAQLGDATRAFTDNSDAMRQAGLSAGQYQQAIRMLPMQLTDVVTSLASGMPLWMVAIQQGGQVRDAFGGIGNAARAVAAELGPLRLAFGGVATAAGVLALAYYKGSEEQDRFNESLILTGNYAGATAEGLGAMARQVGDAAGTAGAAAEVLAQLAGTGKITSDRFEEIAVAALKMEQATGKAAAETVAEFAKIADDPVKAVVQLNEKYHFLTASVYEQIRALQEQGDTLGAASLAEQTLAEAQTERANKIIENLGSVETAWEGVKKVAKEAWDAVLDIGREDTLDQKLTKLQERLSTIQQARINPLVLGDNPDMIALSGGEAGVAAEWASALQGEVDAQAKARREMFDALNISAGTKAYEGIQKNLDATASKSEKLTKALEENRRQIELARRAGYAITAEQEAALERQTRERFKETAPRRQRAFTDDAATRLLQQLREQEAGLQAQLAGNDKLTAAQRAQVEWAQQLADLKNKSILTAEQKSLLASQDRITAQLAENAALEEQIQARDRLAEQAQWMATLQERVGNRQNAVDIAVQGVGLGDRARQELEQVNAIQRAYARSREELARQQGTVNGLPEDQFKARIDALRAAEEQEIAIIQEGAQRKKEAEGDWMNGASRAWQNYLDNQTSIAEQSEQIFSSAFSGMENSLVDFIKTGDLDLRNLLASLSEQVLQMLVHMGVQMAANAALGRSMQAAATAGAIASGTAMAAAYAPAAALASLASFGANAAPATAALTSTATLAQTLALSGGGGSGSFAGLFDKGGTIAAGQWGIAGEYGPEIIEGPARVISRKDTARMFAGAGSSEQRNAAPPNVQIINNGPPMSARTELDGKTLKIILSEVEKDYARKMADGSGVYPKTHELYYGARRRGG
ncbi:phage tail length tape measure family protein [Azotobacter chroococcum]|uniref:phage tail length tape measure family protein n=1 Tax=Azotobacter chroococcum TaxID=353 RepID=UPI0010AE17D9|nr:phage tail length tape measure family protein [Azotobacter chroococcum]TKD32599.1 hypothetical protein FCG41_21970 [Azotobacter chroococcum]